MVTKPVWLALTTRVCTNSGVAKTPGLARRHGDAVVLDVAEDVRADLEIGHDAELVIEIVGAGAAAGDDLGGQADGRERVAHPPQARDRGMRLQPPIGVVLDVLDVPGVALHAAKAQRWPRADQPADLDRGGLAGDAEPMRSDVRHDQDRQDLSGGGRRIGELPGVVGVIHHHGEIGKLPRSAPGGA